jgi:hypothetical protein
VADPSLGDGKSSAAGCLLKSIKWTRTRLSDQEKLVSSVSTKVLVGVWE